LRRPMETLLKRYGHSLSIILWFWTPVLRILFQNFKTTF
jgi:hypothetical protein